MSKNNKYSLLKKQDTDLLGALSDFHYNGGSLNTIYIRGLLSIEYKPSDDIVFLSEYVYDCVKNFSKELDKESLINGNIIGSCFLAALVLISLAIAHVIAPELLVLLIFIAFTAVFFYAVNPENKVIENNNKLKDYFKVFLDKNSYDPSKLTEELFYLYVCRFPKQAKKMDRFKKFQKTVYTNDFVTKILEEHQFGYPQRLDDMLKAAYHDRPKLVKHIEEVLNDRNFEQDNAREQIQNNFPKNELGENLIPFQITKT